MEVPDSIDMPRNKGIPKVFANSPGAREPEPVPEEEEGREAPWRVKCRGCEANVWLKKKGRVFLLKCEPNLCGSDLKWREDIYCIRGHHVCKGCLNHYDRFDNLKHKAEDTSIVSRPVGTRASRKQQKCRGKATNDIGWSLFEWQHYLENSILHDKPEEETDMTLAIWIAKADREPFYVYQHRKIKEEDELDCLDDRRKPNQQMLRIGPQAIFQIDKLLGDEGELENLLEKIQTEVEVALEENEPQNSSRIAEADYKRGKIISEMAYPSKEHLENAGGRHGHSRPCTCPGIKHIVNFHSGKPNFPEADDTDTVANFEMDDSFPCASGDGNIGLLHGCFVNKIPRLFLVALRDIKKEEVLVLNDGYVRDKYLESLRDRSSIQEKARERLKKEERAKEKMTEERKAEEEKKKREEEKRAEEKKRKAEEEKRKAEEKRAEEKREEEKRKAEEKRAEEKREEEKKRQAEEKKRKAEEKRAEERGPEEKKRAEKGKRSSGAQQQQPKLSLSSHSSSSSSSSSSPSSTSSSSHSQQQPKQPAPYLSSPPKNKQKSDVGAIVGSSSMGPMKLSSSRSSRGECLGPEEKGDGGRGEKPAGMATNEFDGSGSGASRSKGSEGGQTSDSLNASKLKRGVDAVVWTSPATAKKPRFQEETVIDLCGSSQEDVVGKAIEEEGEKGRGDDVVRRGKREGGDGKYVGEIERQLAEIEREKAEMERKNEELERKKEELERGKAEMERRNEELERKNEELERGKAEMESKNEELERKNEELERGKAEMERRNEELEREKIIEELDAKVVKKEKILDELDEELERDKQELDAKAVKREKILDELNTLRLEKQGRETKGGSRG